MGQFKLTRSYRKIIGTVGKHLQEVSNISSTVDKTTPKEETHSRVPSADLSLPEAISLAEDALLTVKLENPSPTAEKFELYKKYQTQVHRDPVEKITEKSFFRFLVDHPLEPAQPIAKGPVLGAFHQCYRLQPSNKLIAVAVIDILPRCISSVYFFYDPEYNAWQLGKFSALREICLSMQYAAIMPSLHYYYMGYYIHTCPKMSYKAQFKPAYLLDPESYDYIPFERWLSHLDRLARLDEQAQRSSGSPSPNHTPTMPSPKSLDVPTPTMALSPSPSAHHSMDLSRQRFHSFADPDVVLSRLLLHLPPGFLDAQRLTHQDLASIRVLQSQGWEYLAESDVVYYEDTMHEIRDYVAAVGPELAKKMLLYVPFLKGTAGDQSVIEEEEEIEPL